MPPNTYTDKPRTYRAPLIGAIVALFVCAVFVVYNWTHLDTPTGAFPTDTEINIEEGSTVRETAQLLEEMDVVQSSLYLYITLERMHKDRYIQAGTYTFPTPLTTKEVADAITNGTNRAPHVSLTLTEGFRARELKTLLPEHFGGFTDQELDQYDGVLFPDTYFFASSDTAQTILKALTETFEKKVEPYKIQIEQSPFSRDEVIILASIIEREAKDTKSKHLVSGILQNRLRINMPLQVDAVFHYMLYKTSAELTEADLRSDTPYNTYTRRGLPPHPISNPGIDSIEAVLNPTETEYLYYLTGDDGEFYYAVNFEDHVRNKERYLR